MLLTRLSLSNVRNYGTLEFEPSPGLNVLVGANAQGKSNLLEAISLLGTGKSFRTSREGELIRSGFLCASIVGEAQLRAGSVRLACSISATSRGTRKLYSINGQNVRFAKFLGSIKVVTFTPADLHLVSGPPGLRRALLNTALCQESSLYYRHLARYQKTLMQKAALLRASSPPDPQLLATYNSELVKSGTEIMLARRHYVQAVAPVLSSVHERWIQGAEKLLLEYAPSVPLEVAWEGFAGAFTRRLAEVAPLELARRAPLAGPHRDDLRFLLDDRSLAAFGSQGQQRTAVLALKVAEYSVMQQRSGESPLFLLDDVLSELDAQRARAFLESVNTYEQAFITATEVPPGVYASKRYAITNATLKEVA